MKRHVQAIAAAGAVAVSSWASAAALSGNFCSVAQVVDFPAGVVPLYNWNNLTRPAGFGANTSKANPIYDDGTTASGTTISWTAAGGSQDTNNFITRPTAPNTLGEDIQDGHDQLMAGYLMSTLENAVPRITLKATGLDLSKLSPTYSVIVYFDGDDDVEGAGKVAFKLWQNATGAGSPVATYYGQDTTQFVLDHTVAGSLADYVPITSTNASSPTQGNYVRFDGLTSTDFFVEMLGEEQAHGVALNGFSIIAVPEPGSLSLLGLGLLALRRRK